MGHHPLEKDTFSPPTSPASGDTASVSVATADTAGPSPRTSEGPAFNVGDRVLVEAVVKEVAVRDLLVELNRDWAYRYKAYAGHSAIHPASLLDEVAELRMLKMLDIGTAREWSQTLHDLEEWKRRAEHYQAKCQRQRQALRDLNRAHMETAYKLVCASNPAEQPDKAVEQRDAAYALLKRIGDRLGRTEWGSDSHGAAILNELISDFYAPIKDLITQPTPEPEREPWIDVSWPCGNERDAIAQLQRRVDALELREGK